VTSPSSALEAGGTRLPVIPNRVCGYVVEATGLQRNHLSAGESFDYPSFPPTGGPHDVDALPAGVYPELVDAPAGAAKPSFVRVVHSLEHGYVLILHHGLPDDEVKQLVERFGFQKKVIIAGTRREMRAEVAVVAWARTRYCRDADLAGIQEFLVAYREGPTAPEPQAP
jgi:hypothetical protein